MTAWPDTGAVIIGRNEGERLEACLASVAPHVGRVVYVDSGSTDNSIELARAAGAGVVELDLSTPFTAARARNAGVDALLRDASPEFIQFIDGDCELRPDWIGKGRAFLKSRTDAAVVHGRRRERFPNETIYNRLCDWEWDRPVGEARGCGGDSMMRASALAEVGGFNPAIIAGEEPELCVRLRAAGWKVWSLDAEMTLHDAAMTRFSQWWQRARRAGHAYAEGAALHGAPPEGHYAPERRRAVLWGGILPLIIILGALVTPWAILATALYALQTVRLKARGMPTLRAVFTVLARFPEFHGILSYHLRRLRNTGPKIIEYK